MAVRPNAWVCNRSLVETAGSNLIMGIDIALSLCLLCVLFVLFINVTSIDKIVASLSVVVKIRKGESLAKLANVAAGEKKSTTKLNVSYLK